jgi:hypothetical protein
MDRRKHSQYRAQRRIGPQNPFPIVVHQPAGRGRHGQQVDRTEDSREVDLEEAPHARLYLHAVFECGHEACESYPDRVEVRQQIVESEVASDVARDPLQQVILLVEQHDQGAGAGLTGRIRHQPAEFTREPDRTGSARRRHREERRQNSRERG